MKPKPVKQEACTKQNDCKATSHFGDCASMPSPTMPIKREAPERAFLKACHPESPNRNCTWAWCGSEPQAGAVEYASIPSIVARLEKVVRLWNDDRVTMAYADMIVELRSAARVAASNPNHGRETE